MKKLSFAIATLLLSSCWVLAQSNAQSATQDQYGGAQSTQQPDKSKQATTEKGEATIEGCLSGAANTFKLTDANQKTYELLDDTHQLDQNVGHWVRLSGTLGSTGGGARTAAGPQAIFGVKKVKSLSNDCKQPPAK
ncbi:MAG TPA: hypothetical protein VKL40_05520 [Candidatus Angelobacter sp.]|nr:hypothetical protein [Candidatus Angelobacter sp.]